MTTPVAERPEPTYDMDSNKPIPHQRSSDEDGTFVGDDLSQQRSYEAHAVHGHGRSRSGTHLTVDTYVTRFITSFDTGANISTMQSPRHPNNENDAITVTNTRAS
jgi:hypothetical protein